MADHSKIEWTDATWNIVTGCSVVSPGCTNCYAMHLAGTRLRHHPSREGLTRDSKAGPVWTGEVRFNAAWLTQPLAWKKPRRIFVAAHGDLFHEGVSDDQLDQIFAVMALCPQHVFQVLTKRSARMRHYLVHITNRDDLIAKAAVQLGVWEDADAIFDQVMHAVRAPLANVQFGVSTEDQATADARVPDLLSTPAAVRWVSAEPLLGPIDFRRLEVEGRWQVLDAFTCDLKSWDENEVVASPNCCGPIDWIVVGGESGPGARPMHPDWVRSIRDQCKAAGVPFFFKQHGEWLYQDQIEDGQFPGDRFFDSNGHPVDDKPPLGPTTGRLWHWWEPQQFASIRLGKKAAGRLLDGVEHNAMPEVRP